MSKFVKSVVAGFAISVPAFALAQYVLPPGYTQLMCSAQFRDGYVRYAIFQTKTVELAEQDWRAMVTRYGRPSQAECRSYPNSDTARAEMKEREASSPRLKFEPLAWSPNSERLTMRQDWEADDGKPEPAIRPRTPEPRAKTSTPLPTASKGPNA